MPDSRLEKILNSLLENMASFTKTLESIIAKFFKNLLTFLIDAQKWAIETYNNIRDYLVRFFPILVEFIIALGKLSLFYIPSIIFLVVFIFSKNFWWLVFSVLWFIFITGIGLTYKR